MIGDDKEDIEKAGSVVLINIKKEGKHGDK